MLRIRAIIFLMWVLGSTSFFVKAQDGVESIVVGTVADQSITYGELIRNFNSFDASPPSFADLKEFLPIYLDYKAKLFAGREQGYYNDSTLLAEHNVYAKQAAYTYWLQEEIKPSVFNEFKQRSEVELKPYHILIALDSNAPSSEIKKVVSDLKAAKMEIENGTSLEEVNKKYSSIRGGRSMGGDIPWISAGRTVKEFEDQVYNLEIGQVSEPFRTQFGYHIVLLQDKRKRMAARLTRFIFYRNSEDSAAYKNALKTYNRLEAGESWAQILKDDSEHKASISNEGVIGWVSYQSNLPLDLIEVITDLEPEKPFSKPIKTDPGYSIFKVDSVETYPSEEAKDEALRLKLEQTSYYQQNNLFVLNYLSEKFDEEITDEQLIDFTLFHHPEFQEQSESYLNGLVVYKMNEDNIWSAATVDTSKLRSIYNSNIKEYQYPERPFYYLITARSDSTLDKAIEYIINGGDPDSLVVNFDRLRVSSDSSSLMSAEPFNKLNKMPAKSFSDKFDYDNRRGVFWLEKKLAPRRMSFEEAFDKLLAKFQPQREQDWLKELRKNYQVTPNYGNLREAYQKDS